MTDLDLAGLLERAADRIPVGPPPLDDLRVGASHHRRRRTAAVVISSAAAVVVAMVGTALLLPPHGPSDPPLAGRSHAAIPPSMRLVGIDHAAIAVPASWGTNSAYCGTPLKDTVVIDTGVIATCLVPRPLDVDSVELTQGPTLFDFVADSVSEIDGVPVQRQATTCVKAIEYSPATCRGTVFIPSMGVSFRAESSTDAATVDEILSWIFVVPDAVGVPGYQAADMDIPQRGAGDRYVAAVRAAGLHARVVTTHGTTPGWVVGVSPRPGTMVSPGTEITVTVVAKPKASG